MAWQTKQSMCWPEERNVVDEDGKDVAFFQREEDAKRCVEAVNEVEKMRGALEAAIAGKERAEKVLVCTSNLVDRLRLKFEIQRKVHFTGTYVVQQFSYIEEELSAFCAALAKEAPNA